jgi:SH3 domain-containing YSC84-like protein 1
MIRMRHILSVLLCLGIASTSLLADTAAERLGESATVLREVLTAPDKGIPEDLLRKAHCVVVVPGVKQGAFIVGAKYGRGFLMCRTADGGWGAPGALRIEGGSVGFQIGGSETDVIMLVMDERSMKGILSSKFTLGGAADVAAGPVGRSSTAQTDATMNAKILSYSRARGVFAGIALTGATLRQDLDENAEMYGKPISNGEIVNTRPNPPAGAADLLALLGKYPPASR